MARRGVVADAGVQHRPALAVVDQVHIDVVEAERQGNARPQDARRNLDDLPRQRAAPAPGRPGEGCRSWSAFVSFRQVANPRAQPILGMDCCTAPSPLGLGRYASVSAQRPQSRSEACCRSCGSLSHSPTMTETVAARNRSTRGIVLLGVVVLAWGTMWPVNKALLAYMTPVWSIALRTYISAAEPVRHLAVRDRRGRAEAGRRAGADQHGAAAHGGVHHPDAARPAVRAGRADRPCWPTPACCGRRCLRPCSWASGCRCAARWGSGWACSA